MNQKKQLSALISALNMYYPPRHGYIVALEKIHYDLEFNTHIFGVLFDNNKDQNLQEPDSKDNIVTHAASDDDGDGYDPLTWGKKLEYSMTESHDYTPSIADVVEDEYLSKEMVTYRSGYSFHQEKDVSIAREMRPVNPYRINEFLNFLIYESRCAVELLFFDKYMIRPLLYSIRTKKINWMTLEEFRLIFGDYRNFQQKFNAFLIDFGEYVLKSWPMLDNLKFLFDSWIKLLPFCSKLMTRLDYAHILLMEISIRSNRELDNILKQIKSKEEKFYSCSYVLFLTIYDFLEVPFLLLLGLPHMVERLLIRYQPDWKQLCVGWGQLNFGLYFIENHFKIRHAVSKFLCLVHKVEMPPDFDISNKFLIYNQGNIWITDQSKRKRSKGNVVILNDCLVLFKISNTNKIYKLMEVLDLSNVLVQEDGCTTDHSVLLIGKVNYLIEFSSSEQKVNWILQFVKYLKRFTGCCKVFINLFEKEFLVSGSSSYLSAIMEELKKRHVKKVHIFSTSQNLIGIKWKKIKDEIEKNFVNLHEYATEYLLCMMIYYFKKMKSPLFTVGSFIQINLNRDQLSVEFVRKILLQLPLPNFKIIMCLINFIVRIASNNARDSLLKEKKNSTFVCNSENALGFFNDTVEDIYSLKRQFSNMEISWKNFQVLSLSVHTKGGRNRTNTNDFAVERIYPVQKKEFNTWPQASFNRYSKGQERGNQPIFYPDELRYLEDLKQDPIDKRIFSYLRKNSANIDVHEKEYESSSFSYLLVALFTPAIFALPLLKPGFLNGYDDNFVNLAPRMDKLVNFVYFLTEVFYSISDIEDHHEGDTNYTKLSNRICPRFQDMNLKIECIDAFNLNDFFVFHEYCRPESITSFG